MNEEKILGLLGLAHRAGFVASGAMQTEKALLSGRCKLLLVAADTAPETQKRLNILIEQTETPMLKLMSKLQLGTAVGKSPKAALAINDIGFASSLRRMVSSDGV
ncbi:MAG TPA: ribosomal L7Ae/L30e/S12e/Gadd45 family protein [Negativicutes bacterium]|nr:ribosomal L7Ae/L30e/S12e/Gadd45 family protein [Negativicutes bacterium]